MQDVWTSKNVDTNEILSAINELQSLVQWAAQQPELGEESVVLLVKLQELHKLRQVRSIVFLYSKWNYIKRKCRITSFMYSELMRN